METDEGWMGAGEAARESLLQVIDVLPRALGPIRQHLLPPPAPLALLVVALVPARRHGRRPDFSSGRVRRSDRFHSRVLSPGLSGPCVLTFLRRAGTPPTAPISCHGRPHK